MLLAVDHPCTSSIGRSMCYGPACCVGLAVPCGKNPSGSESRPPWSARKPAKAPGANQTLQEVHKERPRGKNAAAADARANRSPQFKGASAHRPKVLDTTVRILRAVARPAAAIFGCSEPRCAENGAQRVALARHL